MNMKFTTQELKRVNTELWLIRSLVVLAAGVNFLVATHHMVLGFYSLPTIFSAYTFGRRHAVLTAFASVFIVGLVLYRSPHLMQDDLASRIFFFIPGNWLEIVVWGGTLVITAYVMGALYERQLAPCAADHSRPSREVRRQRL